MGGMCNKLQCLCCKSRESVACVNRIMFAVGDMFLSALPSESEGAPIVDPNRLFRVPFLVWVRASQGIGVAMLSLYLSLVSSAKEVLRNKGLKMLTFSVFTVVSTFTSCGFVPTNENMMVFGMNWGLLMMLIPQALLGNTLFPPCLRLVIWVSRKFVKTKQISSYLLNNTQEVGYKHLLPKQHSRLLVGTVFGFILVQVSLDWNSEALEELKRNPYEKVIGVTFQSMNSRHTGETIWTF